MINFVWFEMVLGYKKEDRIKFLSLMSYWDFIIFGKICMCRFLYCFNKNIYGLFKLYFMCGLFKSRFVCF